MKLLLLAGSGESRALASALAGMPGLEVIASLAGVTRRPMPLAVPVRSGGFGGPEGFAAFLNAEGISAVLDATHPFAATMSATAATVCAAAGVRHLHLLRPAWRETPAHPWHHARAEADVARHIPMGATVFLATGAARIGEFANLAGRRVICRRIDRPKNPFPFANGEYEVARPPFSVAGEIASFRARGIDWLVLRNAGGAQSRPKLDAAAALGLGVVMIARPPQPACARVDNVAAALEWVKGIMADG